MPISYHVYANNGQGSAIDYSQAIATVAASSAIPVGSFTPPPLAAPSDNLFAVRAFDDVSGVEEANTEARVHVVIDATGADVSSRPGPVVGLAARWTIGEVALVSWGYSGVGQGGAPAQCNVTATPTGVPITPGQGTARSEQVAFVTGVTGYGCRLGGLTTTSDWTVQVQAIGASAGIVGPPATVQLSKQSGVLASVDGLVVVASA